MAWQQQRRGSASAAKASGNGSINSSWQQHQYQRTCINGAAGVSGNINA